MKTLLATILCLTVIQTKAADSYRASNILLKPTIDTPIEVSSGIIYDAITTNFDQSITITNPSVLVNGRYLLVSHNSGVGLCSAIDKNQQYMHVSSVPGFLWLNTWSSPNTSIVALDNDGNFFGFSKSTGASTSSIGTSGCNNCVRFEFTYLNFITCKLGNKSKDQSNNNIDRKPSVNHKKFSEATCQRNKDNSCTYAHPTFEIDGDEYALTAGLSRKIAAQIFCNQLEKDLVWSVPTPIGCDLSNICDLPSAELNGLGEVTSTVDNAGSEFGAILAVTCK